MTFIGKICSYKDHICMLDVHTNFKRQFPIPISTINVLTPWKTTWMDLRIHIAFP